MNKINDGGPAFPHPNADYAPDHPHHVAHRAFGGMSLRDWFAGQALQAIIEADGIQYASNVTAHAVFAYEQADAMLKVREAQP